MADSVHGSPEDHAGWYSCGRGIHGELGRKVVTEGVDAPGMQNADVHRLALSAGSVGAGPLRHVACGHYHSLAVTAAGEVLAWGNNGEGQLGIAGDLADDVFVSAPATALGALQDHLRGDEISACAGGRSHSIFVSTPGGRCFVAGRLPTAELGRRPDSSVEEARELQLVDGAGSCPQGRVVSCSAGESHTLFVTSEGEVWSWLDDACVRTARVGLERPSARAVLGLPRVARVACGWHHTLALTEDRCVFAFGVGCFGQLGLGACRHCPSPSQVSLPVQCDKAVVDIAAGFASSFAVTAQGWVYAWGSNEKCQLGLGDSIKGSATPKPIDALSRARVAQVSAGFSHAACVTSDGLLYLWGYGAYGQLGFPFNDVRASACLGAVAGVAPLSATGGGIGTKPAALGDAAAGPSSPGHSRPWVQVWPRRCARGPFARQRCREVQCGAYHTVMQAAAELLDPAALMEPEVLTPAPMELSDLPAAAGAAAGVQEALSDMALPPGAGLVESHKTVLRHGFGASLATQNAETFRALAGLFWSTSPGRRPAPAPQPAPLRPAGVCAAEAGEWQRALVPMIPLTRSAQRTAAHPLQNICQDEKLEEPVAKSYSYAEIAPSGPAVWDEVDEAVHRVFCDGSVADASVKLDLAALVENIGSIASPDLPDGELNRGLPPAPCRGLARIECLTPRPFYLPVDESRKTWGAVSGKSVSGEAEDTTETTDSAEARRPDGAVQAREADPSAVAGRLVPEAGGASADPEAREGDSADIDGRPAGEAAEAGVDPEAREGDSADIDGRPAGDAAEAGVDPEARQGDTAAVAGRAVAEAGETGADQEATECDAAAVAGRAVADAGEAGAAPLAREGAAAAASAGAVAEAAEAGANPEGASEPPRCDLAELPSPRCPPSSSSGARNPFCSGDADDSQLPAAAELGRRGAGDPEMAAPSAGAAGRPACANPFDGELQRESTNPFEEG